MNEIILTGDRPTGRLHVGHYVGSLRERVLLQNSKRFGEIYIMVADARHSQITRNIPKKSGRNGTSKILTLKLFQK